MNAEQIAESQISFRTNNMKNYVDLSMNLSSSFFRNHYHLREICYESESYCVIRAQLIQWILKVEKRLLDIIVYIVINF
jgi:hypothetical protein